MHNPHDPHVLPMRDGVSPSCVVLPSVGQGRMLDFLAARLPADAVSQPLAFADQQYAGATSSMQRDIADGLPSELDAQVGAIRRQAAAAGVPTPLLDYTYAVLAVRA